MANAQKDAIDAENILTATGAEKIRKELAERKREIRKEIANKLETATEQGDLSENAAYKSALEEKELNEKRIAELEEILASSVIQEKQKKTTTEVSIGNKVEITRLTDKQTLKLTIVGKSESDPAVGMISIESPIGKAIYQKNKGDVVKAKLPSGVVEFSIDKIT